MTYHIKLGFVTALTVARYPMVLGFVGAALAHRFTGHTAWFLAALLLLVISAVTDLLDGYFARRFSVKTTLGAHMDPLMDKFFYLSTLPVLVFLSAYAGDTRHAVVLLVMTVLFLSRDQWVTFLRGIGSIYHVSGAANWAGKLRTAVNFPLICLIYIAVASPWRILPWPLVYTLEGLAVAITLMSVWTYTRRYRPYLVRAASIED